MSLPKQLGEDWKTHNRSWSKAGLHALAVHRLGTWGKGLPAPARVAVRIVHRVLRTLIRNLYGTEIHDSTIHDSTVIGRRVRIAHHVGLVLGSAAVIGDDVVLRQNVTLGRLRPEEAPNDQPRVGNGVSIGAGPILVGPISIGDGARVGPGAVVFTDVPAGATVVAPPARIIERR